MNNWIYVILILLLFFASVYYLTPQKKEVEAKPTFQYSEPIGPIQEYPYRLKSEVLLNAHS